MAKVTTVITTHAEGDLIIPSVKSCLESSRQLERLDLIVEKIIVMDRPSSATRKAVEKCAALADFNVQEVDFGDQGMVRNHIVNVALGEYIAFLDGDDLWSENWLSSALPIAEEMQGGGVVYPEFNWFFEGSNNVLLQSDDTSKWFDGEALRAINLWDALCLCPKRIYQDFAFSKRKIKEGFAYEDWNWNRRLYEAKIPQKVAKDTMIFKRRRVDSQGARAEKRGVMAEPTASCYYDSY